MTKTNALNKIIRLIFLLIGFLFFSSSALANDCGISCGPSGSISLACSASWSPGSITAPGSSTFILSSTTNASSGTSATLTCSGLINLGPMVSALNGSAALSFSASQIGSEYCKVDFYNSLYNLQASCYDTLTVSAPVPAPAPVNNSCGTRARNYAYTETNFTGAFCTCSTSVCGSPIPSSPPFPAQGGTTYWTCPGINGGTSANNCAATRDAAPPPVPVYLTLDLYKGGADSRGTVISNPAGINCGPSCSHAAGTYLQGTNVTLTATPAIGYRFSGWDNCDSSSVADNTGTCVVRMSPNRPPVTAYFARLCGNSIVNAGEECDNGMANNGSCPKTCSNLCQINDCVNSYCYGPPFPPIVNNICSGSDTGLAQNTVWSPTNGCTGAKCQFLCSPGEVAVGGVCVPACGTAATDYPSTATAYSGTFCAIGPSIPATPTFPAAGSSVSWTCLQSGGVRATCSASRSSAACGNGTVESPEQCDLGAVNNGVCPKTCSSTCTNNSCGGTNSISVTVNGSGSVQSNPLGLTCSGGTCSQSFPTGSNITLTETPGSGVFQGWSGDCSGLGTTCAFNNLNSNRNVTATFSSGCSLSCSRTPCSEDCGGGTRTVNCTCPDSSFTEECNTEACASTANRHWREVAP